MSERIVWVLLSWEEFVDVFSTKEAAEKTAETFPSEVNTEVVGRTVQTTPRNAKDY